MDLHYSQTMGYAKCKAGSFNPLWIYTTLKRFCRICMDILASIPYGFTLLSNKNMVANGQDGASIPYGFTLLSNVSQAPGKNLSASIPYGFTLLSNNVRKLVSTAFASIPYGFTLLSNIRASC